MPEKEAASRAQPCHWEESVAKWLCSSTKEVNLSKSSFGYRTSEPALHTTSSRSVPKETHSDTDVEKCGREYGLTWSGYGFGDRVYDDCGLESGYLSRWTGSTFGTTEPLKAYLARWYVLVVFSVFALTQYCLWNTFGPIAVTLKKGFGWSNADIATLANWDTILYILLAMQICWVVEKKGIRMSVIGSVICSAVGSGLRCLSSDPKAALWAMNAGQFMNGLAGTVAQAVGPVISTVWFPPGERATATAVSSLFASLGVAVSFVVGPLIVQDPVNVEKLGNTSLTDGNTSETWHLIPHNNISLVEKEKAAATYRNRVMVLLYAEFGFSFLLLLLVVAYFPNKPPTPPSNSARTKRLSFRQGCIQVMRNSHFWLLVFVGASTTGIYSGWNALLAVNFQGFNINVSQTEAGWIGCYSTLTSIIGGLIMGRLVDVCTRRIKLSLTILYVFGTLSFTWISLMCLRISELTIGNLYQAGMVGGFCVGGSIPLLYELVIEMTYPVPETVSIGILTIANNIFTFVFLLTLSIPGITTNWMNWCLVGVCSVAVPLFCVLRDTYRRLEVDMTELSLTPEEYLQQKYQSDDLCLLISPSTTNSKAIIRTALSSGSLYVNASLNSL